MVLRKKIKRSYRLTSNIHQKKGANYLERLKNAAEHYLILSTDISNRVKDSILELEAVKSMDIVVPGLLESLKYYKEMLDKHISLLDRRVLKGEKIPHKEKIFSIFEPHVEWIQKGKHGNKVELGHNILLTTDQFHFIVDHEVVEKKVDKHLVKPLVSRLQTKFSTGYSLESLSLDRGFYSLLGKEHVQSVFGQAIMPKVGKKTGEQQIEESEKSFKLQLNKHSAVESNINELEHCGADMVKDKGLPNFKKYIAWSVLSYNLKRLGKAVIKQGLLSTNQKQVQLTKKRA